MHTIKSVFVGIVLLIIPIVAFAQNSTNSPYTLYGYGNIADKALISQRGMGGIGYGLRNPQMINPMNPASYSAIDSMTFMFDLGVTGQMSWLSEGVNNERKINGNLEYIALQFPLTKKLGFGAGIEPVSYVGYAYADTTILSDGSYSQETHAGTGGLSKVYGIFSYEFLNSFSVGVKLSYLFGDITRSIVAVNNVPNSYSTSSMTTLSGYGFLYDIGVQYYKSVGKYKTLTIGAVYSPKIRFGTEVMKGDVSDTTFISTDSVFEMPESFALGFTYNQLGKFTVGADILYQKWSSAKFFNQTNAFYDRLKLNIGGEYIPNFTGNNLLNRIRYRAGAYYGNSYLKVNNSKNSEYGVNVGVGIPMTDRRSFLNLSFEYSRVRPEYNPLSEQYFKVSLSYTFNELWFFKRRVQ